VLAEVAEQRGCDAIVVARRRLAWKLRRLTAVPVIAVRRPRRRPPRSTSRPAAPSAARARTAI
jgi:hypothetical protein